MTKRRFFYDTEFIEYPSTIDLISIGIVGEDGSEFYALNTDFDASKASDWVTDNVLALLPPRSTSPNLWLPHQQIAEKLLEFLKPSEEDLVELWGYYSAYDHVVLCWLFGSMINLPKGMPRYTLDLKQLCDSLGDPTLPTQAEGEHEVLADARWNKQVYEFLMSYEPNDSISSLSSLGSGTISDGFGSTWPKRYPKCHKDLMTVTRPGKAQCMECG